MNIKYIFDYIIVFISSFLVVFNLTPLMINLSFRTRFLDKPNARKIHEESTPLLGGATIFTGFLVLASYVIILLDYSYLNTKIFGFLLGAIFILIIGLIDDKIELRPKTKLFGQIFSSLIFIISSDLTHLLFSNMFITIPILVIWMVGLMNAFNYLDNMDGILTGMAAILAFGFFCFSILNFRPALFSQTAFIALLSLTFMGAALGFLPYNFNPAKIFLGDAGSMFIGYFLSSIGILTGQLATIKMSNKLFLLLPILLLSYAIFDIFLVSLTRKITGRFVLQGGKDHSTHRIQNVLRSPKVTALIVYLINIMLVVFTIIIYQIGNAKLLVFSIILTASFFIIFGVHLHKIPILIPENQIKKKD